MQLAEMQHQVFSEDPNRRARWNHLTEDFEDLFKSRVPEHRTQRRQMTEAVLDNVKSWIMLAGRNFRPHAQLNEETLQANVGTFTTFAFPLVRRVMVRLIAPELFAVQPMTQPTGKIFFLDFKYGTGADSGNRIDVEANFNRNYSNSSEGAAVKEINMEISDVTVTAEEKKLKSIWSIESEQDLMAYHGLSAETELMNVLADEIVREIDRTLIFDALGNVGAGNINWNKNGYAGSLPTEQKAYNETLYDAIIDANNLIYSARYRNATWIVADPDVCGRLEKLNGFKMADSTDSAWSIQHGGRHLFGTLKSRWLVYKDPWMEPNKMLLGYKGTGFLDAGYVYAPFIPFYVTPKFTDPNDFKPRRGMMSRFAKRMVVPEMYATVTLTPTS